MGVPLGMVYPDQVAHNLVLLGVLPFSFQGVQADHLAGPEEDHLCLPYLVHSILGVDTAPDQDSQGIARVDLLVHLAWAHMVQVQDHRGQVLHNLVSDPDNRDNHVHKAVRLDQEEGAHGPCTYEGGPCWVGLGTLGVHRGREMPLNYSLRLAHCLLKLHLQVVEALKHYLPLIDQWPETWTVNWMIQLETGMVLVLEKGMA